MGGFRRRYGASPLHLVALAAGGALSGYAVTRVPTTGMLVAIGLWFAGTLLVHDLVLFPLYAAADRVGALLQDRVGQPRVPWLNHVRIPAILSGLLLLAWFPLVLRLSAGFRVITARSDSPFLGHWLAVTVVLFAGSGLAYLGRVARARGRGQRVGPR